MEDGNDTHPSEGDDLDQREDLLTVFQAAPLAYLDVNGNIHPVGMLDSDSERELLAEALKEGGQVLGANIHLIFETATTDRLGAFLAKSKRQLLHFSCHGHPKYLFVENEQGGGQQLMVEDLKEWISAGKNSLRFVFVSACHSRSAGEAFLAAGVPHVVCCQHDNQMLGDTAAVEFARAFYRALACGKRLKEAFDLGRHGVRVSPNVEDAHTEMNNFALLPEGADHDVPVFYTEPTGQRAAVQPTQSARSSALPLSPQPRPFVGREIEMYKILQALKSESRLVRVTGPPGIGKFAVVQALCHYINDRRQIYSSLGEIYCLPSGQGIPNNELLSSFAAVFEKFDSQDPSWSFSEDDTYKVYRRQILEALHVKRVLIVIDARNILLSEGLNKLCLFLEDLFQGTEHVKIIAIRELAYDLTSPRVRRYSCIETDIEIPPIDFESTVVLFGKLCRHVSERTCQEVDSPGKLLELLVPPDQGHLNMLSTGFSKRSSDILKRLGGGNPEVVHRAAKDMTEGQYERLIAIGRRKEFRAHKSKFQSRAKLEERLSELAEEVSRAVRERDFHRAEEFQEEFDEMERLREELPDLQALKDTSNSLAGDLERAVFDKNFKMAATLQSELDTVTAQIKVEEESLPNNYTGEGFHNKSKQDQTSDSGARKPPPIATRASLEAEIQKQKDALDEAFEAHRMSDVRNIDKQIAQLESRRLSFPTSGQIRTKLNHFIAELMRAKQQRDWDRSEALMGEIHELEMKLELEKAAEAEIGISLGDNVVETKSTAAIEAGAGGAKSELIAAEGIFAIEGDTNGTRGDASIARDDQAYQNHDSQARSRDNEGSNSKDDEEQKHREERRPGQKQIESTAEETQILIDNNVGEQQQILPAPEERTGSSTPGATAVSGLQDSGPEMIAEVERDTNDNDSIQERIERTIENMAIPSHAEVVPDIEIQHDRNDSESQRAPHSITRNDEELFKLVGRLGLAITCIIVTVILVTCGVVFLFIKLA